MVGPRAGTAIGASPAGACSPGEIAHALENGFASTEVSFTGTNVSERDLDVIGPAGVHVNLDLLSQVDRYGRRFPGRAVGPRLNPRGGVMRGSAESLRSCWSSAAPSWRSRRRRARHAAAAG